MRQQMNILSKISDWWTDLMNWVNSPVGTFEKVRKSPLTLVLMIFFLAQPVISLYISTAQDIGWIKHKINPTVLNNSQLIADLERRVEKLEQNQKK
jgi:hypothetical protein